MDDIIRKLEGELVPVIDAYYAQMGHPRLQLRVANNNENIPLAVIEHTSDKGVVADMYKRAHPHPQSGAQGNRNEVLALSKFLQTSQWYTCPGQPKCSKSQIVYRPDIAIIFQESPLVAPINAAPYRVPILLIEVEGWKDGWGRFEQEHKAMEEAASTLAFCAETYLLFIYYNRFEFWHLVRNPNDGCIDVTSHPIYVQRGGEIPFASDMNKVIELIAGILIKQLIRNADVIRMSMAEFRNSNLAAYCDPAPGSGVDVCDHCWVLAKPTSASTYCYRYRNNVAALPTYE